jgi:transcriptional regulator with XRE-family HTH domain
VTDELLSEEADAFAAEVAYWREVRGLSKRALAHQMGFDPSYVSHVESGRHRPTEEFARLADDVLNAGGAVRRRWTVFAASRGSARATAPAVRAGGPQPYAGGTALVVEHDAARLEFDGTAYRLTMRRRLRNTGDQPVTRYLIRISVDRYPGEPERSNAHYRADPLTWDELALVAASAGEEMRWEAKHDRDAFKEVWLLFENSQTRFPLYPGESTWIEYAYTVGAGKWGRWFQRAVRLPTEHLEVQLAFPRRLDAVVWGTETSMTAEAAPLATAMTHTVGDGLDTFTWSTETPQMHARYRLEWRFRAETDQENP